MVYAVPAVYTFLSALCVLSIVVGLPGTWMMLGLAVVVELMDPRWLPGPDTTTFGWALLAGCIALALVAEALELVSGMLGTKAGGGTSRGMWGSIAGGLVGATAGTFIVPVLGTLGGALLGTFLGALWGEMTAAKALDVSGPDDTGQRAKEALRPAVAATVSRALGTVAKMGIGATVWVVLAVAAFMP
jgi:uncharacterized protein YqgC (DUF456 family)